MASHERYKNYICKPCNRARHNAYTKLNPKHAVASRERFRIQNPEKELLKGAKKRAARYGLPFDIDVLDIVIPSVCPMLGIPLQRCEKIHGDSSPSLDRIIPALGYVKGNVMVISYRANKAKNNLTGEELLRIGLYLVHGVTDLDEIPTDR